mmetsp:Transcript_107306/g.313787  ORF Transcript_107306/g.313787 Transcript_107306/m.313787 type:complete len:215 (-) Transcript_107306:45-689(-)
MFVFLWSVPAVTSQAYSPLCPSHIASRSSMSIWEILEPACPLRACVCLASSKELDDSWKVDKPVKSMDGSLRSVDEIALEESSWKTCPAGPMGTALSDAPSHCHVDALEEAVPLAARLPKSLTGRVENLLVERSESLLRSKRLGSLLRKRALRLLLASSEISLSTLDTHALDEGRSIVDPSLSSSSSSSSVELRINVEGCLLTSHAMEESLRDD